MPVSRASSPHVRAKRRRRREEILHSALRAFRARGYHATTLEDIAAELGMRSAALYHYFPDKDAILYACHREGLAEVERILGEARAKFASARDQLRYAIHEHVRVMTDTLEGSALALEVSALSPRRRAEVITERDRYERALREIVQEGVRRGEFRPVDPKLTVFAVLGAINWIVRWYRPVPGSGAGPAELGDHFADHLVQGLTPP
ncbi:MAG TPA: TetR/AcrR family transcriptional regulator [Gemmatimonadales bacterium]|nr:TetR/AcrR family transcriptional regulator [Gemmatimonadales bacterium]